MENTATTGEANRLIDLTDQADVHFWCRIFDVDMAELREAVHHAGHQVEAVRRWLEARQKSA